MPTQTGLIKSVQPSGTAKYGCTQYMVTMEPWEVFFTVNDLKASLCDRARELQVPAVITWKDGRQRTKDIVFVEIGQ